ncbi:M56 family metallopeptidase [Massilia sp. PWRC2]|uniref:M56 family metallopeptidase n=1 Tax=Massilia sp. PWRC2 TaxID=2804626 RepID=UPI003CF4AD42
MRISLLSALAWSLLDFLWQGALIACASAVLLALMRRASAQARYALVGGALLLCAAAPVAGLVTRLQAPLAAPVSSLAPDAAVAVVAMFITVPVPAQLPPWRDAVQARLSLLLLIWSAGAGALALRLLLGLWWVRRRTDPARAAAEPFWQARASVLARRLGIGRAVRVGVVDDLASPLTARWLRPVVLLPAALVSGMPVALLEALLAHELAHICRHDYLFNLLQSALEIVLFYHPAVWWLSRRLRLLREEVADDIAATLLGDRRRLALALAELDRLQFTHPLYTQHRLAHAAHGGHLMHRIKQLLRSEAQALSWKLLLPLAGLLAAGVTMVASAGVQALLPPPPPLVLPALPTLPTLPAPPASPPTPATPATPALPALPASPAPPALPALPAPPAPPASPAAPAPPATAASAAHRSDAEPYSLVRPGHAAIHASTSRADWQHLEAAQRRIDGEFLWFVNDGTPYVVTDRAIVGRVAQAWAPVDVLTEQMQAYSQQMDVHGRKMAALGRQLEQQVGKDQRPGEGALRRLAQQQDKLGQQVDALARQMVDADGARRAQLRAQMDALGARMGKLGEQLAKQHAHSAQLALAQQPVEALGAQMEVAGAPMDALGKTMEALGQRIEAQVHLSEQATRRAIADAVAQGLAQRSP